MNFTLIIFASESIGISFLAYIMIKKKNLRRLIQAVTTKTGKQEIVLGNKQLLKNWI
jgi:hypothetical protein